MRRTTNRWWRRVAMGGLVVACLAGSGLATASVPQARGPADGRGLPLLVAAQQAQPAARDEFVPVSQLPQQEQLPAAPLLVAAYGLLWVLLLAYLVMLWRRLTRVEKELGGVARQVEERRRG